MGVSAGRPGSAVDLTHLAVSPSGFNKPPNFFHIDNYDDLPDQRSLRTVRLEDTAPVFVVWYIISCWMIVCETETGLNRFDIMNIMFKMVRYGQLSTKWSFSCYGALQNWKQLRCSFFCLLIRCLWIQQHWKCYWQKLLDPPQPLCSTNSRYPAPII